MTELHEQVKNGNVARFFKNYWFLLVFIATAAAAWAELKAEVTANHIVNDQQEQDIEMNSDEINALDKKYIEDVAIIKTRLEELKDE